MKKKILIVGFGNIGYRHFQSLYKFKNQYHFYLYDKNIKNILNKLQANQNIEILKKLIEKKYQRLNFDLIIIATPSIKRFEVFKKISKDYKFKNMIIEKFLFNKKKNYDDCLKLVNKTKSKIYVHCPRTEWSYFKDLKKKNTKNKIDFEYYGYNWRIASNSIHFLDVFSFLINEEEIYLKQIKVSDMIKSKRNNYLDFNGKLFFKSRNKSTLILEDNKKYKSSFMKIRFLNFYDEIKINMNEMILKRYRSNKLIFNKKYKVPLTSQLTSKIVNKILKKKNINLTEIKKSIKLHMIIFPKFLQTFKKKNPKIKFLPIT